MYHSGLFDAREIIPLNSTIEHLHNNGSDVFFKQYDDLKTYEDGKYYSQCFWITLAQLLQLDCNINIYEYWQIVKQDVNDYILNNFDNLIEKHGDVAFINGDYEIFSDTHFIVMNYICHRYNLRINIFEMRDDGSIFTDAHYFYVEGYNHTFNILNMCVHFEPIVFINNEKCVNNNISKYASRSTTISKYHLSITNIKSDVNKIIKKYVDEINTYITTIDIVSHDVLNCQDNIAKTYKIFFEEIQQKINNLNNAIGHLKNCLEGGVIENGEDLIVVLKNVEIILCNK